MPHETLLTALIIIAGCYMAWNIGANDVANAMGTSVGSRALTLRQAVIIAAFLEFAGAFFFGSNVTETVQHGIIDMSLFVETPLLVVYGMLAALLAAGIWLQIASYQGWPVSTTHTIIGSVIGFGVASGGTGAIHWENVAFIVSSWLLSPLFGGVIAFLLFSFLRQTIFYNQQPLAATRRIAPMLLFVFFTTSSMILLLEGLSNVHLSLTFWPALATSGTIGVLGAAIGSFVIYRMVAIPPAATDLQASTHWEYQQVERIFGFLQILSACLMAFSHGANDVANAIGPLSAALSALKTQSVTASSAVPLWALALGGCGIVIGLATWGWRVIETIGKKITELTPTRGFAAEFGAALTILIASRVGMPISTTHTLVGAVLGVGMARGMEALNLAVARDIFISWIVTVPSGAAITVAFFYLFKLTLG
jgi:phosphate/sulfate permease